MRITKRIRNRLCGFFASKGLEILKKDLSGLSLYEIQRCYISFSRHAEDLQVLKALEICGVNRKTPGFYLDIGCFDPIYHSNTLLLHKLGWRGMNVDIAQEAVNSFILQRPLDINLCRAVGPVDGWCRFIKHQNPRENSIEIIPCESNEFVEDKIPVTRLDTMISEFASEFQSIDFLDIDCEGLDLEVIQTFPFQQYHPIVICIEEHHPERYEILQNYMVRSGYQLFSKCFYSYIFVDRLSFEQSLYFEKNFGKT